MREAKNWELLNVGRKDKIMQLIDKLLKIRNYQMSEDYKYSLVQYLEEEAETYINKPANSLLDGYMLCLKIIRNIPEKVEKLRM